jgi:hypothetical protein
LAQLRLGLEMFGGQDLHPFVSAFHRSLHQFLIDGMRVLAERRNDNTCKMYIYVMNFVNYGPFLKKN